MFTELPAGQFVPFAAQTLISEWVQTPQMMGYQEAGVEKCGVK